MSVSPKRARQRAKTLVAKGGMTHQQALDGIARTEGHGTWSAMLSAQPADAPAPGIVDPLDPSVLLRGSEVRSAVAAFVEYAVLPRTVKENLSVYRHAVVRVVVADWIAMRIGRTSALGMEGERMDVAFAALVSRWMARDEADRVEAGKTGSIHGGSWTAIARADLVSSARAHDLGEAMMTRIGLIGDSGLADILSYVALRMSQLGSDPLRLFRQQDTNDADGLPQDIVDEAARRFGSEIRLSEWQAGVVERSLSGDRIYVPASAGAAAVEAADIVRRLYSREAVLDPSMVRRVFKVEPGDAGMPFADIGLIPQGSSLVERWIRDSVEKGRAGLRPFSFNPFADVQLMSRDNLRATALPFVLLAPGDHDEQVSAGAVALIADVAELWTQAGTALSQIGVGYSSGVDISDIHKLIRVNAGRMDQVGLFAVLNGMQDCPGIDAAAGDRRFVDLALMALAPFA
jgi:hypothetical protein